MYQLKNWKLICEEKDREIARLKEELERVKIVERAKREMTFDEEYKILKQEFNEIIEGEDKQSEPPFKNCVLRRAMRCIRKQCEELLAYKDLEEQGLLLKLKQVSVNDVVDKLFSHNEIISLWRKVKDEVSYRKRIWYGTAWDIPEELKNCKFVKIFGTIPESIAHADIINIEVVLSEEAEKALAEMEK